MFQKRVAIASGSAPRVTRKLLLAAITDLESDSRGFHGLSVHLVSRKLGFGFEPCRLSRLPVAGTGKPHLTALAGQGKMACFVVMMGRCRIMSRACSERSGVETAFLTRGSLTLAPRSYAGRSGAVVVASVCEKPVQTCPRILIVLGDME